jgi:exopolysaccharide biosynthesis protein
LRVIDQPDAHAGGGVISALMQKHNAIAGVNGGYFTPEFTPLGLMIASGEKTGALQTSKLLGGIILGTPRLLWRDEFHSAEGATDLIQCGPRLVDSARAITGLDTTKNRARTFIATNENDAWLIGTAGSISLGDLADILASPGIIPNIRIHRALNLDGGNSTAIWSRNAEGAIVSDPGWSTVRNYLALVPR